MKKLLSLMAMLILTVGAACSNNNDAASLQQAKSHVIQVLEQDESLTEVTIHDFELVSEVDGKKTYSISYSFKPADPDNFVVAGSRRQGEGGWIHTTEFANFNGDGTIHFSTSQ